jgi:chromosome segregation ATPase
MLTCLLADEKERTKFEDLHRSIAACDDILNSVETNLANFQNDLAVVSADIESLQGRSTALNRRLDNRIKVEQALGPLVEELSVSPETISKIADGHVDESWVKALNDLDRRATAHKKRAADAQSKASDDLGPLLEKLTQKVRKFPAGGLALLEPPRC